MAEMTDEMVDVAFELLEVSRRYRQLYEENNEVKPTIYVTYNDTGETVFISDSFNSQLIREHLNL